MKSHFGLDRCADVQDIYHFIVLSNYARMNIFMQAEYLNAGYIGQGRLHTTEVSLSPFFCTLLWTLSCLFSRLSGPPAVVHTEHQHQPNTCSTLSHLSKSSIALARKRTRVTYLLLMFFLFVFFPLKRFSPISLTRATFPLSVQKPIKGLQQRHKWVRLAVATVHCKCS